MYTSLLSLSVDPLLLGLSADTPLSGLSVDTVADVDSDGVPAALSPAAAGPEAAPTRAEVTAAEIVQHANVTDAYLDIETEAGEFAPGPPLRDVMKDGRALQLSTRPLFSST